jgi:hypothetical protein
MLNNLDSDSRLVKEFAAWLETAADGGYSGLVEDAVDTRDSIEDFFKGRQVRIETDETVSGLRRVHAFTKNPEYKNSTKELLMMTDGEWTVVLAG